MHLCSVSVRDDLCLAVYFYTLDLTPLSMADIQSEEGSSKGEGNMIDHGIQ
jgi:hypothetical protein